MKVSIITATYNSEKTIKSCIDSVLNQTYDNIEIVVIDGASSDSTLDYLKNVSQRHKNLKYISEPDGGIYEALNKGLEKSTGEIIGFVHSDDMLAKNHVIQTIVDEFKRSPVDGIYGNLIYVKFDDPSKIVRNWVGKTFTPKLLGRGWMPAHPTLFLKKSVYKKHGQFNIDFRIAADYEFVLRIFSQEHLKFLYLPETITIMRIGGASNASFRNLLLKSREDLMALRNNNRPWPIVTLGLKNLSKLPQWFKKNID